MLEILFVFGLLIFVLILVSPLVLIFWLGANPEKQTQIKDFFISKRKLFFILFAVIGVVFNFRLAFNSFKEGHLQVYIDSLGSVFGKYFLLFVFISILFSFVLYLKRSKEK